MSDINLSKKIIYLLRHGAIKHGLSMRSDGYVRVSDLIQCNYLRRRPSLDQIIKITQRDRKNRFSMYQEKRHWMIRANQGHSLPVPDLELEMITLDQVKNFPEVIHGTYPKAWKLIQESGGLSKMGRNHVHLSNGIGAMSGIRSNASVLIYIDLEAALKDEIKFYLSQNDVILTPGIDGILPCRYFKKVTIN